MTAEELKYLRALQPEIAKRMGALFIKGDMYLHKGNICFVGPLTDGRLLNDKTLRIPLPMPMPGVPKERTLWGMVDWDRISDAFVSPDGQFLVMKRRGEELHNIVGAPYLALLKALAEQWGTEAEWIREKEYNKRIHPLSYREGECDR